MKVCRQTKFCFTEDISKSFVAIHEIKPVSILDKPIYVGISILRLKQMINLWIFLQIN